MERWLSPRVGFGLVAALYLLSFPYHPALRSPNELCRLWQSRAFVDFGTLHINGVIAARGMVGDLSCTAVVMEGGLARLHPCVGPDAPKAGVVAQWYYPSKAPLVSVLGAPVYWVLTKVQGPVSELSQVFWSRLFVTILPALGMLWLLRRFLSAYVEPGTADLFTLVYALGTMAFSYAETFMSHQLTAVLLFSSFYCAWKVERGEWKLRAYALAGLAAGAAVTSEYTAALGVLCVAAYTVVSRWKRWSALAQASGLVLLGSAPLLGALLWYHAVVFGGPFVSGYKFLNDAAYMGWHQGGFLGIRLPDLRALGLSFFSPLRGLFALSPFLAVGFFGFKDVRAKDKAFAVLLVVLLALHAYFTSSFTYDSWGWTVGPRHLTGILPFLILPVAMAWERLRISAPLQASIVAGLCVSSVFATGLVGFVNYVPDDVSSSVWALAVPLLSDGFFPVSWLAAWIPNPASGAVLLALLVALVAWLSMRFVQLRATPFLLGLMLVLHFGALRVLPTLSELPKAEDHDRGAKVFLESVWLAPRGAQIPFKGP
jgi:4-amino-4-deoxy-L-arabinose transferase-like glycosyltransferase